MNVVRRTSGGRATRVALLLLVLGLAGTTLVAQPGDRQIEIRRGDMVSIFSGDVTIPAGVELRGGVVCVGGDVVIDGVVDQDVVVILGSLTVRGEVGGAVTGVASDLTLQDARIGRELVNVLGTLEMERSRVGRELINVLGGLDRDALSSVGNELINISFGEWFPGIWAFLFWLRLLGRLVVFVLLLLLVVATPERIRLMADEAPQRYVAAFFVGILGYLALLVLLTLLSVTIVGVPLLLLAFWVTKWIGIAGLFAAVGRGLGRTLGREPSLLASVMVCFALYVLLTVLPGLSGLLGLVISGFFGFLFFLVVAIPGVGLAILTRFGTRTALPAFTVPLDPPPGPPPVVDGGPPMTNGAGAADTPPDGSDRM